MSGHKAAFFLQNWDSKCSELGESTRPLTRYLSKASRHSKTSHFISRYLCKKYALILAESRASTALICITIRLPFLSRYFWSSTIIGLLLGLFRGAVLNQGGVPENSPFPEGQIDVSRQKLSPHCLEAIFDSQLPSPKLYPKMPPKLSLPHKREGFLSSFKINPAVRVIARQVRVRTVCNRAGPI